MSDLGPSVKPILWMMNQTKTKKDNLSDPGPSVKPILWMTKQTKTKKDNLTDLGPSVANSVDDVANKDKVGQLV